MPVGVTVSPTAEQRRYVVDVTVSYRPGADELHRNETLLAGFTPGSTQELDVRAEDSSLFIDDTGTLRGELANEGNQEIDDVVLVLEGRPKRVLRCEHRRRERSDRRGARRVAGPERAEGFLRSSRWTVPVPVTYLNSNPYLAEPFYQSSSSPST